MNDYQAILDFWFDEQTQPVWFAKNHQFAARIRERFGVVWQRAVAGECWLWRDTVHGRLAEIIVLDQFSRNLWRDDARAFAQDDMALVLAQEIVKQTGFEQLTVDERKFAIMPMMHSESAVIHEAAAPLFKRYTDAVTVDFGVQHQAIIERFGRYPHRNTALGRASSTEEDAFLEQNGSSF